MFTQFPEEILLMIFNKLYLFDLLQCQKVCHAWYSSAHIILLRSVHLSNDSAIQKFNNSINHNPKQKYVNAVRNIVIGVADCELIGYQYNLENIHKIFLRFPNLEKIYITAPLRSFEDFDEEYCDLFLKSCPKLTVFEVLLEDESSAQSSECLYKLRRLLTKLDTNTISDQTRFDSIEEYIAQFPRLKSLESDYEALSLKRLLPVFQHLPLTSIRMQVSLVNEEDFVEAYLNSKTIDVQNQLINNFANITDVHLTFFNTLCSNSIQFISRYLTLKTFRMFRYHFTQWPDSELQLLHNDIMKLVLSAKELGSVYVDMERSALRGCFSHVATKIYRQTSNATKRCLTLQVYDLMTDRNSVNLQVICDQQSSEHSISLRCSNAILDCLDVLVDLTPIMNVDEFKLSIPASRRRQTEHCTFAMILGKLEDIFSGIPSLKKAVLDIPPSYTEETTIHYVYDQVYRGLIHLQLRELTISAAPDMEIQTMLNRYALTFPDLECLTLYYYSGTWIPENGEFRVILSRYSLKTLTIDMTPLKRNTFKYLATQFFVMELETLGNNKRQLFKVSLDLSSITPITDADLQGLLRGKDYFKAYVGIRSLERLDICMNHNISDEYYSASNLKPITCINMI